MELQIRHMSSHTSLHLTVKSHDGLTRDNLMQPYARCLNIQAATTVVIAHRAPSWAKKRSEIPSWLLSALQKQINCLLTPPYLLFTALYMVPVRPSADNLRQPKRATGTDPLVTTMHSSMPDPLCSI